MRLARLLEVFPVPSTGLPVLMCRRTAVSGVIIDGSQAALESTASFGKIHHEMEQL